jgi:hypothetical protein
MMPRYIWSEDPSKVITIAGVEAVDNQKIDMETDLRVPDQWHTLLHRLWSKAVGAPDYVKAEWMELETILVHASSRFLPQQRKGGTAG